MISNFLVSLVFFSITPQLPLSIATTDDGLAVFANPAGLGKGRGLEFYYLYNFQSQAFLNNNSFVLSNGPIGGFIEPRPLRYGVALGIGQDGFFGGIRYVRDSVVHWDLGAMVRPKKWLSIGGLWQGVNRDFGRVGLGAGVRPFGPRLTVFAESYLNPFQPFFGFQAEPVSGVDIAARLRLGGEDKINFALGVNLSLGRFGLGFSGVPRPAELGGIVRLSQEFRHQVFTGGRRYLEINLQEPVVEEKPGFSLLGLRRARTTYSLLRLLQKAEKEPGVKAVVLKVKNEDIGLAQAQELRSAIINLKKRNKQVWVYAQDLGMVGYLFAAAADRVVLHPLGSVIIPGVSAQATFLKGALEKLGLKVEAHRHGKYKSAVEAFTEDSMSAENREQLQALVDGIYEEFLLAISESRNLSSEQVESLIGQGLFRAEQAKASGLIDTFLYEDELDSMVKRDFRGWGRLGEKGLANKRDFSYHWDEPAGIAVIYVNGSIVQGESGTDFLTGERRAGSETVCRAIKEAGKDKRTKGIVLRVDSPGGDGVASDAIWREVNLIREKKPVVVSMGGLAASGGYYVACNGSKIFALPGTITGSIGVFSLRLITEGLYNKLGIRRQVVKKGERADAFGDTRELTPAEDSMFQEQIDWFYQEFVKKVAKGRNLTYEQVDSVAQGRIWLARDAKGLGLIDSLAGFMEAIEHCRERAGLKGDYQLRFYPQARMGIGSLLGERLENIFLDIFRR